MDPLTALMLECEQDMEECDMNQISNSNDFYTNIDLMVYNNGYEECDPGHSYGPAVRKSWMIHYVSEGKGIFVCDGTTYHLKKGDAFFMQPGKEIYYEADKDDPWCYGWIGMQGLQAEKILRRTSLFDCPVIHYDEDDMTMALFFVDMETAYGKAEGIRDLAMNGVLFQFLSFLAEHFPASAQKKKEDKDYVQQVCLWCEANLDRSYSVQELADAIGLDRSYLSRVFRKKTGTSLKSYIEWTKMEEACRLLETTDLSVQTIARSVGYEDPLYFSKVFSRSPKQSCTAYRAMHAAASDEQPDLANENVFDYKKDDHKDGTDLQR